MAPIMDCCGPRPPRGADCKLIAHLLSLDADSRKHATEHRFLSAVARDSCRPDRFQQWLAQSRQFAAVYGSFVRALFLKIAEYKHAYPSEPLLALWVRHNVADRLDVTLMNTADEEGWFAAMLGDRSPPVAIGSEYDYDMYSWDDARMRVSGAVTAYRWFLMSCATSAAWGLLEGLVVLWATQRCRRDAWMFARRSVVTVRGLQHDRMDVDTQGGVFVANWTQRGFGDYLMTLEDLVEGVARVEGVQVGSEVWRRCEEAWKQVLRLEARLWPSPD
ncbi:hypothetical protein Dda_2631 [Drechslerella dactyloides]|uniref:Thiaminase-2/PQQC domain-containing protein n=1 Tax=Drechslerella dactyloides TaxID=74499 RepID=A0AAD6NKR3_DREDA|nr:hypothetical protein Dda_2631 [Drechslerella dactyloides]